MTLFESFVQQGVYLRAWSPKTVDTYRRAHASFQASLHQTGPDQGVEPCKDLRPAPALLTKARLEAWIVAMRQGGQTNGGINCYIRSMNSFLSWMKEEEHLEKHIRLKLLPDPKKPIRVFSDAEMRTVLSFKPKGRLQVRTWTLILLLVDTGIRIDEALGLERGKVDFDNLNLRVLGKGSKERLVPISLELRKYLFRLSTKGIGRYVFATSEGLRVRYRNVYRDIKVLCGRVGIAGEHVRPHAFRHFFAVSYIRNGGDLYRLSRMLGHTSITTTQLYLRSMGVEHLAEGHGQFSPLARLQ